MIFLLSIGWKCRIEVMKITIDYILILFNVQSDFLLLNSKYLGMYDFSSFYFFPELVAYLTDESSAAKFVVPDKTSDEYNPPVKPGIELPTLSSVRP